VNCDQHPFAPGYACVVHPSSLLGCTPAIAGIDEVLRKQTTAARLPTDTVLRMPPPTAFSPRALSIHRNNSAMAWRRSRPLMLVPGATVSSNARYAEIGEWARHAHCYQLSSQRHRASIAVGGARMCDHQIAARLRVTA
jgi:hypothetical protein